MVVLFVLALHPSQLYPLFPVLIMASEMGIDRIARRDQNSLDRRAKERTERVEIVHGGQRFSPLPFVYGLWLIKPEILLYVLNRITVVLTQRLYHTACRRHVYDRENQKRPPLHFLYFRVPSYIIALIGGLYQYACSTRNPACFRALYPVPKAH